MAGNDHSCALLDKYKVAEALGLPVVATKVCETARTHKHTHCDRTGTTVQIRLHIEGLLQQLMVLRFPV
jgi:hypothetical protein